ncbi:MAG: M48 family metallopeptidase [Desulfurivibrionaceae bacterium]
MLAQPMPYRAWLLLACLLTLAGCENTDLQLATEAGIDAVQAVTLSDRDVHQLAQQAARLSDDKNRLADPASKYAQRLARLTGEHLEADGFQFTCRVYLAKEVNAFAMADGTIRVYSGLMDMMDDGELRFVIGHEMGHVVRKHIRKKLQLAYAASALRKGIASQAGTAGAIAASQLGGFTESLVNAQFSQQEEREADDYGATFLERQGHGKKPAVSALRKLAALGNDHSFLASHPAPGVRADRLEKGAPDPAQTSHSLTDTILTRIRQVAPLLFAQLKALLSSLRIP